MPGNLYLLDGMALAYRAHFALIRSPISTSSGFNTSAIYGFTSTLIELIQNRAPTHLAVVFDTDAPTERHRMHPEYKANREDMPEDLAAALPHLDRIARAMGIPVLKLDGYEADDIIGTLAHRAEADGFDTVYMVTPDKDFGQLVTERIKMYRPSRKGDQAEILGIHEVREKWAIQRVDQVVDMLGLCGDTSDNIPGIPGIGPKTAAKLLAQYDTLENLLTHSAELKGKQKERVEDHAEQARLSKQLATIQLDVPLNVDWSELELHPPDQTAIAPLFAEFEFRTLGKRLFGSEFSAREVAVEPADGSSAFTLQSGDEQLDLIPDRPLNKLADVDSDYRIVDSVEAIADLIEALRAHGSFAFDTETTHLKVQRARLVGISFATLPGTGWYMPIPEDSGEARDRLDALQPIFAEAALPKTGHNLKFDCSILAQSGIRVSGPLFDTMIAHALIEPGQRHNLDTLSEDYLAYAPIRFEALIPNAKSGASIDYSGVDPRALADYAVEDADLAAQLRACFEPKLSEAGQEAVFYEIEMPLVRVLAAMECEGIRMDPAILADIGKSFQGRIIALQETVHELAGREFNLNSPKQLGEVLFDEMQLVEKPKKTRGGQYATNEQVLQSLANRHPIIERILEYRQISKLKSTYIDALPQAIEPSTGRIHSNFSQAQTATGRLSSNDPNLQNIPVRGALGRDVRKAFVPRAGWRLLSADYSQIELRILAALTGDEGLLRAFEQGMDIHRATAARIFRVEPDAVTREQRSTAKMVNFGIPYGISAFGLAQRLGTVSRTEAQAIIDSYFEQFPGIPGYMKRMQSLASERGYVETVSGRRRYLSDINSANATVRGAAERNAINMPIQGTAADMIKLAMTRIHHSITANKLESRLILQVHDELLFDMKPEEEPQLRALVESAMVDALPLACPIEIDIGTGDNWLEAH